MIKRCIAYICPQNTTEKRWITSYRLDLILFTGIRLDNNNCMPWHFVFFFFFRWLCYLILLLLEERKKQTFESKEKQNQIIKWRNIKKNWIHLISFWLFAWFYAFTYSCAVWHRWFDVKKKKKIESKPNCKLIGRMKKMIKHLFTNANEQGENKSRTFKLNHF